MLYNVLARKMLEYELMMMGFPRSEINEMTSRDIQVLKHLLSYMARKAGVKE